jgi:hypothetical protein
MPRYTIKLTRFKDRILEYQLVFESPLPGLIDGQQCRFFTLSTQIRKLYDAGLREPALDIVSFLAKTTEGETVVLTRNDNTIIVRKSYGTGLVPDKIDVSKLFLIINRYCKNRWGFETGDYVDMTLHAIPDQITRPKQKSGKKGKAGSTPGTVINDGPDAPPPLSA